MKRKKKVSLLGQILEALTKNSTEKEREELAIYDKIEFVDMDKLVKKNKR